MPLASLCPSTVFQHDLSPRFQLNSVAPLDLTKDAAQILAFIDAADQQSGDGAAGSADPMAM